MASSSVAAVSGESSIIIMLHEWWLAKGKNGGIIIGGIASTGMKEERESVFLSTVITIRHEANVLETQDGITLILCGFVNVTRSSLNGIPSHISQHFMFGFPFDWIKFNNSIQEEEKEKESSLNDDNNKSIQEEEEDGGVNRRNKKNKKMVTTIQAPLRRSPRLHNHPLKLHSLR